MKRLRLRFSIRTLVIVVTLACCYAACWGPTKRWGVGDVNSAMGWGPDGDLFERPSAIAPLIVSIDDAVYRSPGDPPPRRAYYFWFFGFAAKLPYERELD